MYTHIIAPVSGRVGLRQVDQGNYVTPGDANGIVLLNQMQPITVIFTVPEDNVPAVMKRLHAGATLAVAAYDRTNAAKIADGKLLTVDNSIDVTTGTIKLRAQFDNADGAAVSQPVRQRRAVGGHFARSSHHAECRGAPRRAERHHLDLRLSRECRIEPCRCGP